MFLLTKRRLEELNSLDCRETACIRGVICYIMLYIVYITKIALVGLGQPSWPSLYDQHTWMTSEIIKILSRINCLAFGYIRPCRLTEIGLSRDEWSCNGLQGNLDDNPWWFSGQKNVRVPQARLVFRTFSPGICMYQILIPTQWWFSVGLCQRFA